MAKNKMKGDAYANDNANVNANANDNANENVNEDSGIRVIELSRFPEEIGLWYSGFLFQDFPCLFPEEVTPGVVVTLICDSDALCV